MKQLAVLALSLVIAQVSFASESPQPKMGIGLGIPYGFLGVNAELPINNVFSVSTGAGVGVEKPAFAVGAHLNAPSGDSNLTPRLSVYASNAVAAMEVCEFSFYSNGSCEFEQFGGTAFGFGLVSTHFHMELLVTNSPAFEDRKDELEEQGAEFEEGNNFALVLAYRF